MDIKDLLYDTILEGSKTAFNKNAFVAPNIPERKLNGSIVGVAKDRVSPQDVLLVWDTTLFGGAGDGLLLTLDQVFYKELGENPVSFKLEQIKEVNLVSNQKNKTKICVSGEDNTTLFYISTDDYLGINPKGFCEWFNKIISLITSTKVALPEHIEEKKDSDENLDEIGYAPLDQLPIEVRMTYLKVIMNFLLFDDLKISAKELSSLYSLISRLNIPQNERFKLLDVYFNLTQDPHKPNTTALVNNNSLIEQSINLLNQLFHSLSVRARKELAISLMKDLIYIYQEADQNNNYKNCKFITKLAQELGISSEVLEYLVQVIENDKKIFNDNIDDEALKKIFSNIATGAATVGVPIAALYFSGSVIGLGAAGITSGLAALGLGGILGISGMVTGIAAVVAIGVIANISVKKITGQNDIEKRKQKEAMLIKLNQSLQRTLHIIVEDINYIAQIQKQVLQEQNELSVTQRAEQQSKLLDAFMLISEAGKIISNESNFIATRVVRQRLPLYLNVDRLKYLTSEPTLRSAFSFVLNCYSLVKTNKEERFILKEDLTLEEAVALSDLFQKLGYFDVTNVTMAGLKSLFN